MEIEDHGTPPEPDETVTVYGVELRPERYEDAGRTRTWRGRQVELGHLFVEVTGTPATWTVRRTSSVRWDRYDLWNEGWTTRCKVKLVVEGSGRSLEEAVEALRRAEESTDDVELAPSLRRYHEQLEDERGARRASTRVDGKKPTRG